LSNGDPRLSAIVVAHRRPVLLRRCVDSLLQQTERALEVVIVSNDASEAVERTVDDLSKRDDRVKTVRSPGVSASEARNYGVSAARGAILYFVDDDVEAPPGAVAALLDTCERHPGASIVGGPNLTHPDDPDFAQMTGELLASAWGTGVAHGRYAKLSPRAARERHLILCNLAVRRAVFDEGARFPLHFGGEENVLMGGADARGHELWYSPDVWVHHHRRASLRTYATQMVRYGDGRAIALRNAPRTFHPAYLVPVAFLAYLAALPLVAPSIPYSFTPLVFYAVGSVASGVSIASRRRRFSWALKLPPLFLLTHVAYAVGLVRTLVRGPPAPRRTGNAGPMRTEI